MKKKLESKPRNPIASSEEDVAAALRASLGNQSHAAKMLSLTQPAISMRIKNSEFLQQVMQEIRSEFVHLCESKLKEKVESGNIVAIIYSLKAQGHHSLLFEKWDDKPTDIGINLGQLNINIILDDR